MTKKQLAIKLSLLKKFSEPKVKLEQYSLDSEIASEIIWKAYLDGSIKGKTIADFGCGPGLLGIGALYLEAKRVYFIDIDKKAIKTAKENIRDQRAVFIRESIESFNTKVDTIIQNPPFGTKERHADKIFLETSFSLASKIYSVHKITSKSFIRSLSKDHGFKVKEIIKFNHPIKRIYRFHKKPVKNIQIGCWILEKSNHA